MGFFLLSSSIYLVVFGKFVNWNLDLGNFLYSVCIIVEWCDKMLIILWFKYAIEKVTDKMKQLFHQNEVNMNEKKKYFLDFNNDKLYV